ncbi:MAG: PKD domain-containing protein, partial [Candidatus Poseidoniia archaeon]|nr:PKD domain-containing protein [Candidatus Poseidoniia archaeon]
FMLPDMTLSDDVDRLSNSSSIKYVAAKYDQYPFGRSDRKPVLVGEWELGESPVEQEITFEDTQIWFIGLDNDYEADCEWEFKVLVDGAIARKTMRNCASNGDYLTMESYNLSLSISAEAGQEISIEVWYEGWEDINFYYGSLTHGSGFNISGFQSEAVNQVPVATLLVSPNPAGLGETVYFTGKGYDLDGQVVAFEWKINDEAVSSEHSFTRNDLPVGIHTVSFRVMDNGIEWSDWVTDELTIEEGYTPWLLARITPLFDHDKFFIQVFSENDLESVTVEVDDGISSTDGAAFIKKQNDHTFDGFYNFTGADTYVITATGIGLDGTRSSVSIVVPIEEVTTTAGEPLRVVHEAVGTSVTLVTNTGVTGQVSISVSTIKPDLPEDSGLIDTGLYFLIKIDVAILAELDYANVTIDYDPGELPGGLLEETLDIYHYDSFNQTWEPTNFGGINFEENYVWGHFSNFSVFAVFGSNAAPVADAGPDLEVTPGSQAMFLGSAVDADGYITLYEWDFDGDGVFDYSSSDGIASHVFDEEGSYLVILRVTDNEGSTGFDETVVTVGESSSFAFLDSPLFRIFFPTVILLLAVGYYAYRKYGTFGAGAFGAQKSKFELKKEEDVTVVCPACGIDMKVPRLGTLQLVICDNCGNEGEMEV